MLKIREESGQTVFIGWAQPRPITSNPTCIGKFAAYWGTNNVDHQARICHSTTVASCCEHLGLWCDDNSYNDIHKSRAIFLIGGNPAEAHPVSLMHIMKAKEQIMLCDRLRSTVYSDSCSRRQVCPFPAGLRCRIDLGHLVAHIENGWEDKEFIRTRVWGMDDIKKKSLSGTQKRLSV